MEQTGQTLESWRIHGCNLWDAEVLGPQPDSFGALEALLTATDAGLHSTLRPLVSGLHELAALQRAAVVTKHVARVLGAVRLSPVLSTSAAVDDPVDDEEPSDAASGDAGASGRLAADVRFAQDSDPAHVGDCVTAGEVLSPDASSGSLGGVMNMADIVARERDSDAGGAALGPGNREGGTKRGQRGRMRGRLRGRLRSGARRLRGTLSGLARVLPHPRRAQDGSGAATHLLLIQPEGTPVYGSELTDADLAIQIFEALRNVNSALVHGDITTANIVWDPTGYFFQLVDLEFATWREGSARVVSPAMAFRSVNRRCHGSTPATRMIVHGTIEFCSYNQLKGCWPTACDDFIGLFWALAKAHCPVSLWWGGLDLPALMTDEATQLQLDLPLPEEASLLAYAQAVYLTSDVDSVLLRRSHEAFVDGKPVSFRSSVVAPFVPEGSTALERWKHYALRAWAARHVLRLTLAAGSSEVASMLADAYGDIVELVKRLEAAGSRVDRNALAGMSLLDAEVLKGLRSSLNEGTQPMQYNQYLDLVEDSIARGEPGGRPHAIPDPALSGSDASKDSPDALAKDLSLLERSLGGSKNAQAAAALVAGPDPVSFSATTELVTSEGTVIWGKREAARHGASVLARPPWRLDVAAGAGPAAGAVGAQSEVLEEHGGDSGALVGGANGVVAGAQAMRVCAQSGSMGFELLDNPWDCAVAALQVDRARWHQRGSRWRQSAAPRIVAGIAAVVLMAYLLRGLPVYTGRR